MKLLQLTKMKVSFKNIAKYYILQKVLYTFQSKYFILKEVYILILLNRQRETDRDRDRQMDGQTETESKMSG